MARVYLFNPLVNADGHTPRVTVTVNGDGQDTYAIAYALPRFEYIPYSTSGRRVPGRVPDGNAFIDDNQVLVQGDTARSYRLALPPDTGDLIAYLFRAEILLLGQDGVFIGRFVPTGEHGGLMPPQVRLDGRAGDTPGSVYVFNLGAEAVRVSANGGPIAPTDTIAAWSDGLGSATKYTPTNIAAARVLNPSDGRGRIANGRNTITVVGESVGSFTLTVDGGTYPLNQNLLLYLLRDRWCLTDQFGATVTQGPIAVAAGPAEHHRGGSRRHPSQERAMSETSAGNVYVFNVFSESLTLSTNGQTIAAGEIPGWFTEAGKANPKFRPNSVAVPRVLNASDSPGKVFNGTNALTINWIDGLFVASVLIDGAQFPLNQDMLLFIDRNSWRLVNEYGVETKSGQVQPIGDVKRLLESIDSTQA